MSEVELAELLRNGCVCSSEFGKCTRCTAADTIIRLLKERDEARARADSFGLHAEQSVARCQAAAAQVAALTKSKDEAYAERNKLVSFLARLYPSGTMKTDIPGWDAEWHGCVFIDTPQGQMSWHYHDSEAHLFTDLPPYHGEWDGHTTEEKYRRLKALEDSR